MSETATMDIEQQSGRSIPTWVLPAILAGLLLAAITVAAWLWWDGRTPGSDSADAGFARDMIDHHAQAVEMSMIVWQRSEDPEIQQLAYDIATSQQAQIGMMQGWLTEWELPMARSEPPMAWGAAAMTDHDMENIKTPEDMPGMLSREQIDSLRTLDPAEMDIAFLTLMIEHHRGGISMAKAGLELMDSEVMLDLARAIDNSQTFEITNMQAKLDARQEA